MEELFSVQALVHYYDKSSVDHVAVKRLLLSAKVDSLQLLLSDGSTTTLQNYVLIPRLERPNISDVISTGGEAPETVAAIVMLAEARAAADSIASSTLELDIACSALERLLGSITSRTRSSVALNLDNELSINTCTLNRLYKHGLTRRNRFNAMQAIGGAEDVPVSKTSSSILTAVNARLRLCDLATHCLAVVGRQCVTNEDQCREAIILSTRLLSLAVSLADSVQEAALSASFSSRNSLRTALISGAIHIGVIASENFDIDISPWIRHANHLMLNNSTASGRTQIIAAVFGGMIPSCIQYRKSPSSKTAARVIMPLSILHSVLEEQLEKKTVSIEGEASDAPQQGFPQPGSSTSDRDKISKAAQSFLGERVVAAEEDGDEGRIAGASGYNASENYIKRAGEGMGIRDLLCSLLLSAVSHYSTIQSQLPQSSVHLTGSLVEDADALSDGCTSNSEGHPGSIDLFDHRVHMRAFGYRPSASASDSEQELGRTLSLHREVAVLCIEALSTWVSLDYISAEVFNLEEFYSLLETVCSNASILFISKSISTFDVRAALANYGTVCGSILSQICESKPQGPRFWEEAVQKIAEKSRHCVILMKPLLSFAEQSARAKGMFACYVSEFLRSGASDNTEQALQRSPEDYLVYLMSLISQENSLHLLRFFSDLVLKCPALEPESGTSLDLRHFAICLHIMDFLAKLSYGLSPSRSTVQISIVRLCHRPVDSSDTTGVEEITLQDELTVEEVAALTPPKPVLSSLKPLMLTMRKVMLRMTSQVLSPIWAIVVSNGKDRSGSLPFFSRLSSNKDVATAGESALKAVVTFYRTIDMMLRAYSFHIELDDCFETPSTRTTRTHDPITYFFAECGRADVIEELMKSLLSELQSALIAAESISVSLLFRLECAAKALRHAPVGNQLHCESFAPSLLTVLYGCLRRFLEPLEIERYQETPGVFGKSWYEELEAHSKSIPASSSSVTEVGVSSFRANLETGIRYCACISSGDVKSIVKSALTELSLLIPSDARRLGSAAEMNLSMLCDIVAQCWPEYIGIAATVYSPLKDCLSLVLSKHGVEDLQNIRGLPGTLIRMSSWRLFIEKAESCGKTLHFVCQLAEMSNSSQDFDSQALLLALSDNSYACQVETPIPLSVLQSFRPNLLPALVAKLLIPQEEAAVHVHSRAQALQCFTAACKRNSAWCNAFVSCLERYVSLDSESAGPIFSPDDFFRKVLIRSVVGSATMSTAVFDVVDVLAQDKSKSSAIILETLFSVSIIMMEEQVLHASNVSIYRVVELLVRICVAYEEVISKRSGETSPRLHFLGEFVKALVRCMTKLKEHFACAGFGDKQRKLVVGLMALLHSCRNGHSRNCRPQRELKVEEKEVPVGSERVDEISQGSEEGEKGESIAAAKAPEGGECRTSASDGEQRLSDVKVVKENLCTFTATGSDFVKQHWYFCYTCGLTGSQGVCKVCASICHDGHDLSYSKHSRFYCDCGASGNESKPVPAEANPAESSDSDSSSGSGGKDNPVESCSSTKRRKCLCLKPGDSDSSEEVSPSSSEAEGGLDSADGDDVTEKSTLSTGDAEMSMLAATAPLIDRCFQLYAQELQHEVSEFNCTISGKDTVNCALDMAHCLLDSRDFFSTVKCPSSHVVPEVWSSLLSFPEETVLARNVISKPSETSGHSLARTVKIVKGGSFSLWGPGALREKISSKAHASGFPMSMSCFNEHLAIGHEDGSISFFDTAAVLTCKSALENSNIEKIGEISVPFGVRHLSFHPDDDETLLVVGDSAICIAVVSLEPFLEKARIDVELGLNHYSERTISPEPRHLSEPPNVLLGADWISHRECGVLVKTKAFVKVFDVVKDNVSPSLFVPVKREYLQDQAPFLSPAESEGTAKPTGSGQTKSANYVVDVVPLPWWRQPQDGVREVAESILLGCTRNGDLLFSHSAHEGDELVFGPGLNILSVLSCVEGHPLTIIAVAKGYNPGIVWFALDNGALVCMCLLVRDGDEGLQSCITSIHYFGDAFEPLSTCSLVPFTGTCEGVLLYRKGKSLAATGIFTLDDEMNLSKRFFSGGASSRVMGAVSFLPSVVFEKLCRGGGFLAMDDGSMYRLDLNFGSAQEQFLSDNEMSEISSTLDDIRMERSQSRQSSRKALVQERYNPVPSILGYVETGHAVAESKMLFHNLGADHGDSSEPNAKPTRALNAGELIISPTPHVTFQFRVTAETKGVLVGARLKFGGNNSSKNRVPQTVHVFGREVCWVSRNGVERSLDIPFTVLESDRSSNEVSFELEPRKIQIGDSSGADGLVAIDSVQLFEISRPEFDERKLQFDKEAEVFYKSSENAIPNKDVCSDTREDIDLRAHPDLQSTFYLFKNFDPRYAAALVAIELACQSFELSLESAARLSLAIGVQNLEFIHDSSITETSPLSLLEENGRRLLEAVFLSELRKNSKAVALKQIVTSFVNVSKPGIYRSVIQKASNGLFPRPFDIEITLYTLRVASRQWFLLHSFLQGITANQKTETPTSCRLPADMVKFAFNAHMRYGQPPRRLYMSPRRATENAVDAQLVLLAGSIPDKQSSSIHAKALLRMFCDSSQSVRLFSTRRLICMLQDTTVLGRISRDQMNSPEYDVLKYTHCCDIGYSNTSRFVKSETKAGEAGQKWAYRCDSCEAECKKEWWHCMDCEDFDLCSKCIRSKRIDLESPHSNSHMLVRGDTEHNLDEVNDAAGTEASGSSEESFLHEAFSVIVAELANLKSDNNCSNSCPIFLDVARMLSGIIGPQTEYPARHKYMERLCAAEELVSGVLQSITDAVDQFNAMKNICHLNDITRGTRDWDFAFLFLQVFTNVRDSLLLAYLFRCGIPLAFSSILKKLEPMAVKLFRHAISCSAEIRGDQETKMSTFQKVWMYRSCTMPIVCDDDTNNFGDGDIISPSSPFLEDENICPAVGSFLQLTVYIVDFLGFALQSAHGPDVDVVRQNVPRGILCDLVCSETKDPRLKGNSELQRLIQLARKLLLVVNGMDESRMHREVDTHVYRAHVTELEKSVRDSSLRSKYTVQVEVAATLKSLHRLAVKRPSTWRDFSIANPVCLEALYNVSLISDSQSEATAVQLIATACSISKDMAVESVRSAPVMGSGSRSSKPDSSPPKGKKALEEGHRNQKACPKPFSALEDSCGPSSSSNEWVNVCARLCNDEEQVQITFFSENDFSILKRMIFTLLLQRQSFLVRTACSRILCCIIARAAISSNDDFVHGLYSALVMAMRMMPCAGALGVELGQSLEVFLAFCCEGYFNCLGTDRVSQVAALLISSLRASAASLVSHPNAHIYKALAGVVDLQGYYLESEPCATCSTEAFESAPPTSQRLEAIRIEAKFTDREVMCRLVSAQAVSGVSVKVVEPRRTRRVKKIDIFYSPRIVTDPAELKNSNHPWRHFASIGLTPSQLEGKVELTVPISTANLRFCFSEFYSADESSAGTGTERENPEPSQSNSGEEAQRSTEATSRENGNPENLQCPRCSRSVTDRYGICRNCHENAFQCRQCRNINYENLDGFLCNECGYCKHGRFEFSVLCKSSFVAERVTCEEDRKRASVVIEKETMEVHRRHEQLKKMRSTVLQALSLGPKSVEEPEVSKVDPQAKPGSTAPDLVSSRTGIAALEVLLGGHLVGDTGEKIPPAAGEPGSSERLQANGFGSLDLSGRRERDLVKASSHPFSFLTNQAVVLSRHGGAVINSASLSRQTSLLSVLYSKECKALFMSMSQSIRVLSATRSELMQYAGSSLKRSTPMPSCAASHGLHSFSLSAVTTSSCGNVNSSPCYGCGQSFLSICVDLLYSIVRFGDDTAMTIKNAELALELLRLSSLCERKEVQMRIRRLIVHIVSEHDAASDVVCTEISKKIEFCIDSFASIDTRSLARVELAVLEDIAHIEDRHWENRFRTVIHLLFRASRSALSCASVAETIVLPCLRIALYLLRADQESGSCHVEELACIGNLQAPTEADAARTIPEALTVPASDAADSAPSNANGRIVAPELDSPSTEAPSTGTSGVAVGDVYPRQFGDGADSCASSERRNTFRLDSDQLSCSGAPSSIGTAFEDHCSDEDNQCKLSGRYGFDLNGIVSSLKEAHVAHESSANVERWLAGYQTHEDWLSALSDRRRLEQGQTDEEKSNLREARWYFQKWRTLIGGTDDSVWSSSGDNSWAVRLILLAPCGQVREMASALLQSLISCEECLVLRLIDMLIDKSLEKAVTVGDGSREFFDLLNKLIAPRSNRLYLIAKGFPLRLSKMILTEAQRLLDVENRLNGMHDFSLSHGFVLQKLISILKVLLEEISKMRTSVRVKILEVEDGVIVRSLQQAYLFIRRLISLQTRLTDDCGNILCEILSSTDHLFFPPTGVIVVQSCVSELRRAHDRGDVHTIAVLLKQLCNMLCPENTDPVCYLTLNKAPTQDEFIRGSMSKNPYSSSSFSGPLMRDVKNKICQDLDLPGLLEDDFAMELLVADNVIKLDLPIMDVYEQVWRVSPVAAMAASSPVIQRTFGGSRGSSLSGISTGSTMHPLDVFSAPRRRGPGPPPIRQGLGLESPLDPPMVVVYRLSGLDGAATEPIIDSLESDSQEDLDLEDVYKSTEILGDVGGLEVLLTLLSVVGSWGDDAETAVREPALKLLRACCEVSKNRSVLAAAPGTLSTLLDCAASAFEHAHNSVVAVESAESLLIASEKILAVQSLGRVGESPAEVSEHDFPIQTNVSEVLSRIQVFLGRLSVVSSTKAEASILHLLPFLIQGISEAVETAIDHFSFHWGKVDKTEHHQNVARQFATVLVAAPRDYRGQAIVLRALQKGCAADAVKYLLNEFPVPKVDNKETWNVSLKHTGPPAALKLLTGLAYGCGPASVRRNEIRALMKAALAPSETTIPMLCQLEMTASSNSIGSIAEELLEALKEDEGISDLVDRERRNLKASRRAAAFASRKAILRETGLSFVEEKIETGSTGTTCFDTEMFGSVVDEVGPSCVVCGDGFKSRPDEALGLYVLNRRCPCDCSITGILASFKSSPNTLALLGRPTSRRDGEHIGGSRSRSSGGCTPSIFCYSTVSQFNAIHISCHREAARSDRSSRREEWEGATLRNSQTVCNNIFPVLPPVTCTSTVRKSSMNGAYNSTASAVEFYFNRLLSLGRTNLSHQKLAFYDLGRSLVRFADGGTQVFSEHSKGGGPHSNACLIPHLVQLVVFTLDNALGSGSTKTVLSKNPRTTAQITELQKYIREEWPGDIACYLSSSLVLHSVLQWSQSMPTFLRLALKEVDNPAIALRLIAFTDAAHLMLKCGMAEENGIDKLKMHIGKDEAFSGVFADRLIDMWEKRIRDIQNRVDFWEAVSASTEYYINNSSTGLCRPQKFAERVEAVTRTINDSLQAGTEKT